MAAQPPDLYVIEHRVAGTSAAELELLQAALADACGRISRTGAPVSFLSCLYLPESSRLLCVFKAAEAALVARVLASVQIAPARMEPAGELPVNGDLGT